MKKYREIIDATELVKVHGRIKRAVGTLVYASVPAAHIGEICRLKTPGVEEQIDAEVVGLWENQVILTPLGGMEGLSTETEVIPTGQSLSAPVGPQLLGRVLDGLGRPLDEGAHGPLQPQARRAVHQEPPQPMARKLVDTRFSSGVRVIDGLLTTGYGQRVGIFAAAGGGKSTLMGMLVLGADVDICVICLIGERGREVREFIEHQLGEAGMRRSVLIVATSDRPAVERAKAAQVASCIAEYFRDQGKRVLLLMDSVTRYARALREIGLAAGEPPTRRGFPPSVFAELPRLLERSGQSDSGSITAFYTVLVEGDDMNEPISDEVRSILDGHIILSHKLGARGHFPAVDVLKSASRVMNQITDGEHVGWARRVRELMSKYEEIELLVRIGEYQSGSDPLADQAIRARDAIERFLRQDARIPCPLDETLEELKEICQ